MKRYFFAALILISPFLSSAQQTPVPSIIPLPVSMQQGSGKFELKSGTVIELISADGELKRLADYLAAKLSLPTGYRIGVSNVKSFSAGNIHLAFSDKSEGKKEAYKLTINPAEVLLTADSAAGIFYGMQTLLQLLPKDIESKSVVKDVAWSIPSVTISDQPRFGWRGAMFDVSRHFFTKEEVKDFIDNIVRYKFNVFHFHLSDDQGWRLEIKSLPKLTEVGAWRAGRSGKWANTSRPAASEPKTYGGFYTHEDIRELVKYAQDRFVTILPEIDVPGHSMAAVASYPELSCTEGSYQVNSGDRFMLWHSKGFSALIDNTLCPANEKVYDFLDKVFTEVAQLFPSEYIHMGGDECAKDFWLKSAAVKSLMAKEGLKDMHEVQSYFVKRVQKIIKSKGRKLIGWDEILEGGLPEDATVMSWRGMKGGIQAAKQGHKVVMTPSNHVYLDLMQGDPIAEPPVYSTVRLKDAYKFEPIPDGVDDKLILGGQGNLWTEHLQNMRAVQYMMWPRVLAVAEAVWSPRDKKNWTNFVQRVENEFGRLDIAQTKYSRSMYDPIFKITRQNDQFILDMQTEVEGLDIHYSYDESFPDNFYPKYSKPLIIPADVANVRVVTYRDGQQMGKIITMPVTEMEKRTKKK